MGVPWVAFDCPFGPASIIKDGSCGFLIENGNSPMFTNKLNFLMENEDVRHKFSKRVPSTSGAIQYRHCHETMAKLI